MQVREWVPLLSRATTGAFPLVRVRLPLVPAAVEEPQSMEPGSAVEVWCVASLNAGELSSLRLHRIAALAQLAVALKRC